MTRQRRTRRARTRRARRAAALAALGVLGLSACGGGDDSGATAATEAPAATDAPAERGAVEPAADAGNDAGAANTVAPSATPATGGSAPTGLPFDDTFGRDLIIEMDLTMSTPDVQATLDDARRLTEANGGAIFRADVRIGETLEDGSVTGGGTLEIRIPPGQLDRLVEDLSGVARVSNIRQDTQDVTEQLVDLEIRIRQARTGIAQIEVLYEQATEFEDLIEIEQELARRQVDLERLLAAQRGVEGRVELSTLNVEIVYEPIVDPTADPTDDVAESDGIADAFRDGWDAFAGAAFAIAFVLAVATPFIVVALVVLLAGWLITRRRALTRRLPAPTPAPAARTDDDLVTTSHED